MHFLPSFVPPKPRRELPFEQGRIECCHRASTRWWELAALANVLPIFRGVYFAKSLLHHLYEPSGNFETRHRGMLPVPECGPTLPMMKKGRRAIRNLRTYDAVRWTKPSRKKRDGPYYFCISVSYLFKSRQNKIEMSKKWWQKTELDMIINRSLA